MLYYLLLGIQFVSIIASFGGISVVMRQKPSGEQKILIMAGMCMFWYCFTYFLEMQCRSVDTAMLAIRAEYIAIPLVSMYYLEFVFYYCRVKIPKLIYAILGLNAVNTEILVQTSEWNNWYYSSVKFVWTGTFPHLVLGHGTYYYINFGIVLCGIISAEAVLIYRAFTIKNKKGKKKLSLIRLSTLFLACTYLCFCLRLFESYDPISIGMTVTVSIIIYTITTQKFFEVVDIAQQSAITGEAEAMLIVDEGYNYLDANKEMKTIYPELKKIELGQKIGPLLQQLFIGGDGEFRKEDRIYEPHISNIYKNKHVVGYYVIIFDVTQNRAMVEQLRIMKNHADEANRTKSNFLANMSHEIRTPMNAIIGYTELILQDSSNETVRQHATDIKSASANLLSIINSILDISKIESGKLEIIESAYNTKLMLYNIVNIISIPIQKKKLRFYLKIDEKLPSGLYGDETRVVQILINILNNAIKFTQTGAIMMSLQCRYLSETEVRLIWNISDTGSGIKKDDIARVFQRFEQADKEKNYGIEGTGLGLSISKSLAEAMGGRITVDSIYDVGTTFTVEINQKISEHEQMGNVHLQDLVAQRSNTEGIGFYAPEAKILVVDDNQVNLDVTYKYLRHYRIEADLVDNGLDAINMIAEKKYNLIFMDQMMPEMDGIETTRRIRTMPGCGTGELCIIALTANAVKGVREFLLKNGFDAYVTKPMNLKTLERTLREFLKPEYIEYRDVEKEYEVLKSDNAVGESQRQKIPEIENVQAAVGLENCAGDRSQYLSTLEIVVRYGAQQRAEIERCLREEDYKKYTIEVHALKSNMANIGAIKLSVFAREQEMAGREGDIAAIKEKGNLLAEEFGEMLENIQKYLDGQAKEYRQTQKQDPMADSRQTAEEILQYMEKKDYKNASDLIDLLEVFSENEDLKKAAGEMKKLFEKEEYDTVDKMLHEVLGGK